jgi:hypothetical protein
LNALVAYVKSVSQAGTAGAKTAAVVPQPTPAEAPSKGSKVQ